MQKITVKQKLNDPLNYEDLPFYDKQKLVDVFAWLIQEDRKQNPALYPKVRNKKKLPKNPAE